MYHYVPEGARVLDVGCSTGNFGIALEELKQCKVVGIDISESDIAEARDKISEAYVLDITSAGLSEKLGKFDVIVFADVLEHLTEPRDALHAAHSLLNVGGIVVYSIPHMGHLSVRLDLMEGRFPYTELGLLDRTHLHYYDRHEVHDIFDSTAFRIVAESPTVSGYPDRWTAERLGLMGLTPTPQFFELMKHTEADVYQYVGMAVPRGDVPPVSSPVREEITPPDELRAWADQIVADNERLIHEIQALRNRVRGMLRNPIRGVAHEIKRRIMKRTAS